MGAALSKKDNAEIGRKVRVAVASFEGAEAESESAPGADFVWALVNSLHDTGHIHFLIDDTVDACLCGMALAEAVEACGEACKTSFASYKHFRQLEVASSATVILLTLEQNKFSKFKEYEEGVKESTPEAWVRDDQLRQAYEDSLDKVFVVNANSRPTSRVFSSEESWERGRVVNFNGTPAEKENPGRHNSNALLVLQLVKKIQLAEYKTVAGSKMKEWGEKFVPLLSIANHHYYDEIPPEIPNLGAAKGVITYEHFNAASLFEVVKSIVHENRDALRKCDESCKLFPAIAVEAYIGRVFDQRTATASRVQEHRLRCNLVSALGSTGLSDTLRDGAKALYENDHFIDIIAQWCGIDPSGPLTEENRIFILLNAQKQARDQDGFCAQDLSHLFGGMANQLVADTKSYYSDHRPLLYRLGEVGGVDVLQFNVLSSSSATGTQNPTVGADPLSNLSYLHRDVACSVEEFTEKRNIEFTAHVKNDRHGGFGLLILQEADTSLVAHMVKSGWLVKYQAKPHHVTVSDEDSPFCEIGAQAVEGYGNLVAMDPDRGALTHSIAIGKTDDNTLIFAVLVEPKDGERYWVMDAHLKFLGNYDNPHKRAEDFVKQFRELARAKVGIIELPCVFAGDMNAHKPDLDHMPASAFAERKMKEQYEFFHHVCEILSLGRCTNFTIRQYPNGHPGDEDGDQATMSSYNIGGLVVDHIASSSDLATQKYGDHKAFVEETGLLMAGGKRSSLKPHGRFPTIFRLLTRIMIGDGSPF